MKSAVPFALAFVIPFTVIVGMAIGGVGTLLTVVVVFGVVPLLDTLVGPDPSNPDVASERALLENPAYRALTFLWVPEQLVLQAIVLAWVTGPVSPLERIGAVVSLGLVTGGGGITVAHELMHRPGRLERALAEVLMLSVSYPWFCIEHILGHHRHVATPRDPASARFGESVWHFVPRSVAGGLFSAARLEAERLVRQGRSPWSWRHRFWRYAIELAGLYALVAALSGGLGVIAFAAQGVIAFSMLEVINYVEHYGLTRRETAPGRFERTRVVHSWNASHRVGNWLLFNLQRHSDHHWLAARPYQVLRHFDESPQLPSGYAVMLMAALVPPLWFRVMNPRVESWRARYGRRRDEATGAPSPRNGHVDFPAPRPQAAGGRGGRNAAGPFP